MSLIRKLFLFLVVSATTQPSLSSGFICSIGKESSTKNNSRRISIIRSTSNNRLDSKCGQYPFQTKRQGTAIKGAVSKYANNSDDDDDDDDDHHHHHHHHDTPNARVETVTRRTFGQELLVFQSFGIFATIATTIGTPLASVANDDANVVSSQESSQQSPRGRGGKPFAPVSALVPATRVKVWIEKAFQQALLLEAQCSNESPPPPPLSTSSSSIDALMELNSILSTEFTTTTIISSTDREKATRKSRSHGTSSTTGVSKAYLKQYQEQRQNLSVPDQLASVLVQSGELLENQILKRQQRSLEGSNDIRAALNFYTSQLQYSADSYVLTASPQEKKRMIRNDQLPSVTSVVTSDLDLRDLYRNEFLTALDDTKAEVAYQIDLVKTNPNQVDCKDVIELMTQTHTALTKWFDLIEPQDVQDALDQLTIFGDQS